MAGDERLGASFSIDVSELKAGLAQANRLIKESQSEFKAAAAGMDDWTKSEEGLTVKLKSLNDITGIQREKVNALQNEYDSLIANGMDPASAEAVNLRIKINNETAALAKNEAEISKQEAALNELRSASDSAGNELDDLGNSAENAGDGFTVAKGAAADLIANGITSLVGACKNAISSIANLAQETQEYREDMGKLETAFQTAGKSSELATKTYKDMYAVLGEEDRSVEAVNHLAKFVETEQDMAKWTDICTGVWGAYGDSLPIEGLTEAANETVKTGKVTGVLADALNWAGESEDDFNASLAACKDETERTALITDKLNGLYSESAKNYKENNKGIMEARNATSNYADAQAELAETIEPLTTKFTELKTQALQYFIDKAIPFIQNNLPMIATLIGGITTAIVVQTAATKIKIAMDAAQAAGIGLVTAAQKGLNAAMKANMIGIVITAITALVAAFMYLWKNCEGFRNFWINMWEKIKSVSSAAWKWIKGVFSGVGSFFSEKFKAAYTAVKNIFEKLPSFFSGLWGKIKSTFSSLGSKIGDAIGGAVKSAINGIISLIENRINSAIGLINGAIDLINELPAVNIGKIAKLNLPRMAKGGVVTSATTAMIGEDGAEAVVPLERNTEWIDKVADAVAAKSAGVVVNQTNNYSQAHSRYEIYKSKQATMAAVRLALGSV